MPFHLVAHGLHRRLLFTSWPEGVHLWRSIVGAFGGVESLIIMPDHLHLLHELDVRERLAQVLAGYARRRNRARGTRGPLFAPLPPAQPLVDEQKRRRAVRYLHLNPCRAGLVLDPLSWPLSTHLDVVGLTVTPAASRHPQAERFHRYVSSDPSVGTEGTPLPGLTPARLELADVLRATSAATRTPMAEMTRRGSVRTLFLRAARALTEASAAEIAAVAHVRRECVSRLPAQNDATIDIIARLAADPRVVPLHPEDLRLQPAWRRYLARRRDDT